MAYAKQNSTVQRAGSGSTGPKLRPSCKCVSFRKSRKGIVGVKISKFRSVVRQRFPGRVRNLLCPMIAVGEFMKRSRGAQRPNRKMPREKLPKIQKKLSWKSFFVLLLENKSVALAIGHDVEVLAVITASDCNNNSLYKSFDKPQMIQTSATQGGTNTTNYIQHG